MGKLESFGAILRDLVALVIVVGIALSLVGMAAYVGSGLAFEEQEVASVAREPS